MQVCELMVRPVVVAQPDATLEEMARLMLQHNIGCIPIIDAHGKLCGIVTDSDFVPREVHAPYEMTGWAYAFGLPVLRESIQQIYDKSRTKKAGEVMSYPVVSVTEETEVDAVVSKMIAYRIHHIPVVRNHTPIGIVARHDLLLMMV